MPDTQQTQDQDWRSKTFRVLSDGFVRVVDIMGDDSSVVQAARISYGSGTKKLHEDRGLIRYLMRHRHSTPFEMCEIKLHVRVPMDCWRQWIRHRTANVNEYSTRYSEAIDAIQTTNPTEWRTQSSSNRQGSDSNLGMDQGENLTDREMQLHQLSRNVYRERLEAGVSREQARKDLPLSTYTEAYWKIDLHNLMHFLSLRMDSHAQYEIRTYANVIGRVILANWVPLTWEAFEDYRLESVSFSRCELNILRQLNRGDSEQAKATAIELGWLDDKGEVIKSNRELVEFESKLHSIGQDAPWTRK